MKAPKKFFDPLYGWVQEGAFIPNDGYGHRLKAAGHVVPDEEYDTKVLRPKPKRKRKNAKRDDTEQLVNTPESAGTDADSGADAHASEAVSDGFAAESP